MRRTYRLQVRAYKPMQKLHPYWLAVCAAWLSGCQVVLPPLPPATENPLPPRVGEVRGTVDFARQIKPIFEHRCVRCHSSTNAHAGLDFQSRSVLTGTAPTTGTRFIVPGAPDRSLVYLAAARKDFHPRMPADGWGLSQSHRKALHDWIQQGANWPSGEAGQIEDKAFQNL